MRPVLTLIATLFCGASLCAAQASAPTSTPAHATRTIPSGLNFSYDAQHDQINTAGMQMKAHSQSSPTVSPTTGTITVTLNIKLASHFPRKTQIHCSLTAIGGQIDILTGSFDGGIETANAASWDSNSGTATCTLVIPYSWSLPQDPASANGLILAFGASAVNRPDNADKNDVYRSTLQVDGIENLPANGGSAAFVFDVAL